MRKITLIAILLFVSLGSAYCQDIYTYAAASTAGAPSFVDPNIATASNLTPIGTGFNTPCAQGFSGITGFTGAVYSSAGPCIQVSLTAAAGYTIHATGFTANLRNSPTGPVKARLAYSSDGGTTWVDDATDHVPFSGSCATSLAGTTLASWTGFSVTNTALLFRIYPFAAPGATGTIQIYALHIIGDVNCITPPSLTVTPGAPMFCTGGAGVALTASGAGVGGVYTWSPAASLSSPVGPTVTATPTVTTTYAVSGVTSLGCHASASVTVTVNPGPVATVTASGSLNICNGDSVIFTAASGLGYTYQWFNGAGAIPGANAMAYTATLPGSYSVAITNGFGCTATSASSTVVVKPRPSAAVSAVGSPVFCQGGNVVLNASLAVGNSYQWYIGPTPIPGATNASYTDTGSGMITVKVTGSNGCANTSAAVSVSSVPAPYTVVAGPVTFCLGNSTTLTANVGGASSGIEYQWRRNGAPMTGATAGSYVATATGDYSCMLNIGGTCADTTAGVHITVHPTPVPVILSGGGSLMTSTPFVTYQWYISATPMAGATARSFHPAYNGNYTVKVVDSNGCSAFSVNYPYGKVGIPTILASDVNIYPNPADAVLHIDAPVALRAVITSMEGRTIIDQADATTINVSPLATGMYIIMLYDANGERITVQKFVKE